LIHQVSKLTIGKLQEFASATTKGQLSAKLGYINISAQE
jgi:hypothetical protein